MSGPPQPIACLKCNTINFTGKECKQCGEDLKVVDETVQEIPVEPEEIQETAAQEGVSELIRNEAAKAVPAAATVSPAMGKPTVQPLSGVDKEMARRKLRARLRDARSARAPLSAETEVLNKHGQRIVGARRVPVTSQAPLSTPETPYERM
jgi:hypothetical protein